MFSQTERLSLANQFRILKAVDPDYGRYYDLERKIAILENGFEGDYPSVISHITDDILKAEDCNLVNNILLLSSWAMEHKDKTTADLKVFSQPLFDGNHEDKYLRYAKFLYEEYPGGFPGTKDPANGHYSSVPMWTRMVDEWIRLQKGGNLTEADIAKIMMAANLQP